MNNNPRHMIAFQNARAQVIGPLIGGDGTFHLRLPTFVAHALIQAGVSGSDAAQEERLAGAVRNGYARRMTKLRVPSMDQARMTATVAIALLTFADAERQRTRDCTPTMDYVLRNAAIACALVTKLKPGGSLLANAARLVTLIEREVREAS